MYWFGALCVLSVCVLTYCIKKEYHKYLFVIFNTVSRKNIHTNLKFLY